MARRLSEFREGAPSQPDERQWRETTDTVMAFDQTLASTGWAVLMMDSMIDKPYVVKTGMVKTDPTAAGGFVDTYARALLLLAEYRVLLDTYRPDVVIHEMPAVFGHRTDSALVASIVLRIILSDRGMEPVMYGAQRVKKIIAGKANASKQEVQAGVKSLVPDVVNHKPRNEHTYDACALGLTWLFGT